MSLTELARETLLAERVERRKDLVDRSEIAARLGTQGKFVVFIAYLTSFGIVITGCSGSYSVCPYLLPLPIPVNLPVLIPVPVPIPAVNTFSYKTWFCMKRYVKVG